MHDLASRLITDDVNGVRRDEILARHSSWGIGGAADIFAEPTTPDQISLCVRRAAEHGVPLLVIGHGTNILFPDEGVRGLVVKIGSGFGDAFVRGTTVVASAGIWVPGLARLAVRRGLSGIEHTIGIPGTLGGLVVMNGGSRRQGIGSAVRRVVVIERSGDLKTLDQAECEFAYRSSVLQRTGAIVCSVEFELTPLPVAEIRSLCLEILRDRRHKFPRKERSCGSVFLSTPSIYADHGPPGRIIENAGLKGFRIGGAEVSVHHANFVLNKGGASAKDVLLVIRHIRDVVEDRFGVALQCEVKKVLENGSIVPAHTVVS